MPPMPQGLVHLHNAPAVSRHGSGVVQAQLAPRLLEPDHPVENMELVRNQCVEKPVLYDALGAMESNWCLINANHPKAEQINGDPLALMYHCTSRAAVESSCSVGFSRAWATRFQYGVDKTTSLTKL